LDELPEGVNGGGGGGGGDDPPKTYASEVCEGDMGIFELEWLFAVECCVMRGLDRITEPVLEDDKYIGVAAA